MTRKIQLTCEHRRLFKWERALLNEATKVLTDAEALAADSDLKWACELIEKDELVRGWRDLARFLHTSIAALHRAHEHEQDVRRVIHQDTKRHAFAHPSELMNLIATLKDRREGGIARRTRASQQPKRPRAAYEAMARARWQVEQRKRMKARRDICKVLAERRSRPKDESAGS
jgi:hypothetical protein